MNIALIKPKIELKEQAEAFKGSFIQHGELTINGSCGLLRYDEYEQWVGYIEQVSSGRIPDRTPSDTYFAVELETGVIVGIVDIRHYLEKEHFNSGHIGYSVCPAERCKGYGTEILWLGLEKARALGLCKVLLSCYQSNAASRKVIENNGGILEKEVLDDGKILLVYWIELCIVDQNQEKNSSNI